MTQTLTRTDPLDLRVYRVQAEQTTGKNRGKLVFLVIRETVDGKIQLPRGYKLIAVMGLI